MKTSRPLTLNHASGAYHTVFRNKLHDDVGKDKNEDEHKLRSQNSLF
jgi:hypothetical protein